jgi:hypothetical protein
MGDALLSAAALVVLLAALVSIDERVREHVWDLTRPESMEAAVQDLGGQARTTAAVLAEAAKDQSIEHAPLVIFAVAGSALVLAMLRL